MTARPVVNDVGDQLYASVAPISTQDEQLGWAMLLLCGMLGIPFDQLLALTSERLLDPAVTPAWMLPWLSQFAGVTLTPGGDEATWRSQILSPTAYERGTVAAVLSAARRHMTGRQRVRLVERDGGPWQASMSVYAAEVLDQPLLIHDVQEQVPWGVLLTINILPGQTYLEWQGGSTYQAIATSVTGYSALAAKYATYDALRGGTSYSTLDARWSSYDQIRSTPPLA